MLIKHLVPRTVGLINTRNVFSAGVNTVDFLVFRLNI